MSEHGHEHAAPEKKVEPEVEAKAEATRAIARTTFAAVELSMLDPENRFVQEDSKNALKTAEPDALEPALQAANLVSMDSRREYDKHDGRELDVRVKEWKDKFVLGVQHFTNIEHVAEGKAQSRVDTLAAVGIDAHADHHDLDHQVEAFRKKYVAEDKSDIGQFVKDVAESCKEGDTINLDLLAQRLSDIAPMLSVFGKVNHVNALVADFGMAYGILSQKNSVKEEWITKTAGEIKNRPHPEEHVRLKAVWDKIVDEDVKGIPTEEPGDTPRAQKNAEDALGRPLTPEEHQMLEDGKSSKEIVYRVKQGIKKQKEELQLLPGEVFMKQDTPVEAKQNSMMHANSVQELTWIFDEIGLQDKEVRDQFTGSIKTAVDIVKKHKGQPVISLPIVLNEQGQPIIMEPVLTSVLFEEGVDMQDAMQKIQQEMQALPEEEPDQPPAPDNPPALDKPEKKLTRPPYSPDQSRIDMTQEARQDQSGAEYSLKHEKGGTKNREDRVVYLPEYRSFAAIDGVGQSNHPDIAAEFAKEYLSEAVQYIPEGLTIEQTQKYLQRLATELSNAMRERTDGEATMAFGYMHEAPDGTKKLITVNIGDSRIYRMRGGQLEALTTDNYDPTQPRDAQMVHQKKFSELSTGDDFRGLSRREKNQWHNRNIISQALGSSLVEPDITVHDVNEGDIFIGTTDGIHDNLTDTQIQDILRANPDPQQALHKMVIAARDRARGTDPDDIRKKKDDISGFIVKVDSDFPTKGPIKSLNDIADPNSPWGENQGSFTFNLQRLLREEQKLGRQLTPIEQYHFFAGQPIEHLDEVEKVYRDRRRARSNRLEKERYDTLIQEMQDLESRGMTNTDDYRNKKAELRSAEIDLENIDQIQVYTLFQGDTEQTRDALIQSFNDADSKKPAGTKTVMTLGYRKTDAGVTLPHASFKYVPDTSTTAAAA